MAEIKRLKELNFKLAKMAAAARRGGAVVAVGYTQSYAVYVHEDLTAFHETGEAKYLERPARELGPELTRIVVEELKRGRTMAEALLKAGLRLQRESQLLVPVDTGALRNSAFTRLET